MAKILSVTLGTDWVAAGQVATLPVMQTAITQALFGNIDRDHFASGTNPVVASATAPTSPAVGLGWFNTTTGVLSAWTGSEWIAAVHSGATAPASTAQLWVDTTLDITRRYVTRNGLTGWHPEDNGLVLAKSADAATIAKGATVSWAGHATERKVAMPVAVKSTDVVGVAMEAITTGAQGVIALCWSGRLVSVLMDSAATYGALVANDGVCSAGDVTPGVNRTIGPVDRDPYSTANGSAAWASGFPMGCFGIAMAAKDATTHLAPVVLMPVGFGMQVHLELAVDAATEGFGTAGATSGWIEKDLSSAVLNAKHLPMVKAGCLVRLLTVGGSNAYKACSAWLSSDQSQIFAIINHVGLHANTADIHESYVPVPLVDATASPTALGSMVAIKQTLDSTMTSITTTFQVLDYIY
jgi:hypothetical protein